MAEHAIPVDLHNPGQVFACLGFLEAADVLLGDAEGGFDWSNAAGAVFKLQAKGNRNPFEVALEFLADAKVEVVAPQHINGPWPRDARLVDEFPAPPKELLKSDKKGHSASALPIAITDGNRSFSIASWLEGDGRPVLKLFAGKQIAAQLASNMLAGDPQKPGTVGHTHLLAKIRNAGFSDPFGEKGPVGGRFGYDSRGAWDAMSVGWSLDRQGIPTVVSPVVELLAAVGLENARPNILSTYEIRYSVWQEFLPPMLARSVLGGAEGIVPKAHRRLFRGHLGSDQQYKKCFPAQEESYA